MTGKEHEWASWVPVKFFFLNLGGDHTVVQFVKNSTFFIFLKYNVLIKLQYSIKILDDPSVKVKNNKNNRGA